MAEGFFWGNDPNVNQQLRQRIAMAMLSQKKGYPKTLGEGLASIGDAMGDIGMMRMLQSADVAQQAQARGLNIGGVAPAVPPTESNAPESAGQKSAYAPSDDDVETPASKAIDTAVLPPGVSAEDVNVNPNLGADEMAKGQREVSSPLSPVMTPPPSITTPPGKQPWSMFAPTQMNPPGMAVAPAGGNAAGFKEPNLSEVPPAATPGPQSSITGGTYPTAAELADKTRAAGERFNNPFNMWHDKYAAAFGGKPGMQITPYDTPAVYPSKEAGAAGAIKKMAESPQYSGKTMQDLIGTWVGHGQSYAPIIEKMTGIPRDTPITREFLASDDGLKFLKAMSRYETKVSEPYPLSDQQWKNARDTALGGAVPQASQQQPGRQGSLDQTGLFHIAQDSEQPSAYPPTALSRYNDSASDAPPIGAVPAPTLGRDAIAKALMSQQPPASEVPQPNPMQPPISPLEAMTATSPPEAASNPPIPFAVPGAQLAQAQTPLQPRVPPSSVPPSAGAQSPEFGYVMEKQPPRPMPQPTPQSAPEQAAQKAIIDYPNNPYVKMKADQIIQDEQQKRAKQDAILMEQYRAQTEQDRQLELKRQEQIQTQAQRQATGVTATREADIARRFGGAVPYQQFVGDMSKSYDATQQLANTLPTFRQAKQALAQSYTGAGAELKLDASKMLRNLGVPGDYAPAVATEMLQSRMKAIAGGLIKSTVGSQNISDADRDFVEKAYSGTIKMEPESLRKLLGIAEDTTIRSVNRHNDRLLSVASDPINDVALRNQYRVPMQYGDQAVAYLKAHPDTANLFDSKFGKGHAKAVLAGTPYGQ
jgi:hypothetical protein